jgi:hypothetical protein
MTQEAIANGYHEALRIVRNSRIDCAGLTPVWQKLQRICDYLNTKAAEELADTLS